MCFSAGSDGALLSVLSEQMRVVVVCFAFAEELRDVVAESDV